ncbi:MAG: TrmH family RNA methyltransferase, partial [Treponema sp.]|nr:TrmH family RNA methyltransferase [Treponema sp.]
MIAPEKLFQLSAGQKRRKLALTFGELERDIAGIAEPGLSYSFSSIPRAEYTKKLVQIVLEDPKLNPLYATQLQNLLKEEPFDERRTCNIARNALLELLGTFPAEWDLVIAPHAKEKWAVEKRNFFPGVCVYAEDIRSPFNMGSIFRTAEA